MTSLSVVQSERPRNVSAFQAAAILYGDWGTSKAYVVGLAFALASYSSFWLILGVSILNILVGLNYIIICKYYPHGGGVYASVRHRSEVFALLGAFLIICDYMVTASLSALSGFSYLAVQQPELWACGIIAIIGLINYFGPRHSGNLALFITLIAVSVVILLGILSLFHIREAVASLQPLQKGVTGSWVDFVGVIVALSGIEAIANMTGVMELDKGSNRLRPSVVNTSTPAIIAVMLEVSIFTALFSLAVNALPGLVVIGDQVSAPGYENVRDSMLRYMGEVFCSQLFSSTGCQIFGSIIGLVFGVILLSAVNTAIVALSSLLFIMAKGKQLPRIFGRTNRYGVPTLSLLFSTVAPIVVLLFASDMTTLAGLYAVGFVGAIATNLGSTSTDKTIKLRNYERIFMFVTFLIMLVIEITIFIDKSHARTFVVSVIAVGLILRALALERLQKKPKKERVELVADLRKRVLELSSATEKEGEKKVVVATPISTPETFSTIHLHTAPILCAVTGNDKSLEFALRERRINKQQLYILFVREQKVLVEHNLKQEWLEDEQACEVFDYALKFQSEPNFNFLYDVSDFPALNIVRHAKELQVSTVVMCIKRKNRLLEMIRGDLAVEVLKLLPPEIDLVIVS